MSQAQAETAAAKPERPSWPLFYAADVREIQDGIRNGQLAQVVRGVRGVGKSTVLQELNVEHRGTFVRGRDPASAMEQLREARQAKGRLYIDDADYLLDPGREDASQGKAATPELEEVAFDTVRRVIMRGDAVVVSYMYPDQLLSREYSGTISRLSQIGNRHRLPRPWAVEWPALIRRLLELRFGDLKGAARVLIAGTSVLFDEVFIECWTSELVALTGGHPALVASAMRSLAEDLGNKDAQDPGGESRARPSVETLSEHLRFLLELELTGEAVEAVGRRIAAIRKEPEAYEALVSAAQAGGEAELDLRVAARVTPVLEHEGIARYDRRRGRLEVRGMLIRAALTKGMITLIADPRLPLERGRITVEIAGVPRHADFSGQAWRILRELYSAGGKRIPTEDLARNVQASSPNAVRALVQRIKTSLDAAEMRGLIGVERKRGYFLSTGRGVTGINSL